MLRTAIPSGETRGVADRLGAGRECRLPKLALRRKTGELEQPAPHEASLADEFEQGVLREHRPALALPALEHFVEHRRGHSDDDQARDEAREERVTRPEPVSGEVPRDRPEKDEQTEAADDPRRAHVRPKRIGAARTDSVTSHLLPSILRAAQARPGCCGPPAAQAPPSFCSSSRASASSSALHACIHARHVFSEAAQ
jgi:hypothetical protein